MLFAAAFSFSFLSSLEFLLNFFNDDSFFYIKTAYNFSSGFGSTFDRVNFTNGYHPLWFILLSVYFYILNIFFNFTPELYFRFAVLLIIVLNIITLYVVSLYFKISNASISKKQLLLFTPLFFTFAAIRDFGLETHLLCFLTALYLYVKSAGMSRNESNIPYKCLLLALIFLTRVDYLVTVIPVLILSDYCTSPQSYRNRYLILSLLSLMLITVLYFSVNYIFFNEIFPVTAKIKNTFPEILFLYNANKLLDPGTFTNQFAKIIFNLTVLVIFLIIVSKDRFRQRLKKNDYFLFGICCASFLYLLFNILFNRHALKEWYVAFPAFVSSLLLVRIIIMFPVLYIPSQAVFTTLFIFMFYITRIENPKWNSEYNYALEIKKITKPDDRIFMIDLSGIVGYFSDRKIINGDGLINSFEYQNYLSSNRLKEYIADKKINYYSTYSQDHSPVEIKDSSGYYTDWKYSDIGGNFKFVFPERNLVLKYPYYYSYAISDGTGSWYLFKLDQ